MASSDNTVTCTPHYKDDAHQPWVVQEGVGIISVWMSPNTSLKLEDIAQLIENFAATQVNQKVMYYSGTVQSMTFRGQTILRGQMADYFAKDYMNDGETFNLRFTFSAYPKPWLIFCPCFICCVGSSSNQPGNQAATVDSKAPQAQYMH